ncbi:MAG: hypothetical protein ACFFAN_07080, partial [Promethearchaeota archaeon]
LKINDINNDGRNEIIIGGLDGLLRVFKCKLSYELIPFWTHQFGSSISGILIDDINNDKKDEIIVYSLDKTIRILNPIDGSLVWGQIFEDGIGDVIIWIDNKELAKKQICACGNDGTIRIFDGNNGNLLWFKQYSDKIRCISRLNSNERSMILCGGDDKTLHFIDKNTHLEVKFIEFNDYIWQCISFPEKSLTKTLISSYSFAYFDTPVSINKIQFSSKLVCIDENLNITWELKGKNCEFIGIFEKQQSFFAHIGTTKGEILIIDSVTGEIMIELKKKSSINMTQVLSDKNLLFSCHEDGTIFAYFLEDY